MNSKTQCGPGNFPYDDQPPYTPSPNYPYHKMRLGHPSRPAPYPDRFRAQSYGPVGGASRNPTPIGASRRASYDCSHDFRGENQANFQIEIELCIHSFIKPSSLWWPLSLRFLSVATDSRLL